MAYQMKQTGGNNGKLDLLAYGLPGTEKTLSIGRMARAGFNPFVLACDPGGMTTLKDFQIPYIEINKPADCIEIIRDIHQGKLDLRQFGMLVVDGASNLSYMCLKATGENANDRRLDYANYWIGFRRIIDELRRLPFHFYVNCHAAELKADSNRWGAAIEGAKFSVGFTGQFNTVVAMRRIQDGSKDPQTGNPAAPVYIQTQDDGIYNCKDRTNSCNMYERDLAQVAMKILSTNSN